MKRSVKSLIKFLLLILLTIVTTVIVFRLVRTPKLTSNTLLSVNKGANQLAFPVPPRIFIRDSNRKIDWHNYAQIKRDLSRTGNGEHGMPAVLPADHNTTAEKHLFDVNGFNGHLSDHIPLDRSVPDIRHPDCKNRLYIESLPVVSVVVPFHNEHLSTLLRTAISVINRSPSHLIKEVILVDDGSTKDVIKKPLDDYIAKHLPKVSVLRLKKRAGLIRARLEGAKNSSGDVLLFLDSHTEANVNWLPPLLEPIAKDYRTCVCPFIDVVAYDTFQYRAQDEGKRGAFDWEFFYKRLPRLPEDANNPAEPFESPVMAGGLFAISSKFFWELGGYDSGLDIWGGEQYELSFKIWQCGGRMIDAPCSRVGHIYRKFAPFPNPGIGDFVGRNYRRVAEVWMDEYAEYLYKRRPHYRNIDPGDLTEQKAIRKQLNCKPFKWFMEEIAFDLIKTYPPVEPPNFASGYIKSSIAPDLCAYVSAKSPDEAVSLKTCPALKKGNNLQNFSLSWHKDIRVKNTNLCWDVASSEDKAPIVLFQCHGMHGNQLWKYDVNKKWLVHGGNPRCLDADLSRKRLYVTRCSGSSETQRWLIEDVNYKRMLKWNSNDA